MELHKVKEAAQHYSSNMFSFLRDLIRIPGEGCCEKDVVLRIKREMEQLEFDRVEIDPLGNVLGFFGTGPHIIAFDGHIDTVGVGSLESWNFDPYIGFEDAEWIGGRGASDQLAGIVSAIYGVRIMKDLDLLPNDCSIIVVGSVQEEECEGLSWQYILSQDQISPELVVLTEPTDGNIYRGHRGRMDIIVETYGISAHGSAPDRGINAIYQMSEIVQELETLNQGLQVDDFLGKGTLAVTKIFSKSPSRCAVADYCAISIDRRLTIGENAQTAISEIQALPSVKKHHATVKVDHYSLPSWRGLVYEMDNYFPAWTIPEEHIVCQALLCTVTKLFGVPTIDKWMFSTNGVSIAGLYEIPCIGYGPGTESQAHTPNEKMLKRDLIRCAAVYAAFPYIYFNIEK